MKATKEIMIEWGNEKKVVKQFKTLDELLTSGYADKLASNFGYEHLIIPTFKRWSNYEVLNILITSEDPKTNYGLDFIIWIHYKTSEGMTFLKELSFGSSVLSSQPLRRVMFFILLPEGVATTKFSEMTDSQLKEYGENVINNRIGSFMFSTNVAYKKDMNVRYKLVEMCQKQQATFV